MFFIFFCLNFWFAVEREQLILQKSCGLSTHQKVVLMLFFKLWCATMKLDGDQDPVVWFFLQPMLILIWLETEE